MIQDIDKKSNWLKLTFVTDLWFQAQDDSQRHTSERCTPHGYLGMAHGSTLNTFVKRQHRKRFHLVERV
jgi:hypothetical protein